MPFETIEALVTSSLRASFVIGGAVLAAIVFRFGMRLLVERSRWIKAMDLEGVISREVMRPGYLTIILAGIYFALPLFERPGLAFWIGNAIQTIVVLIWAVAGIRLLNRCVKSYQANGKEIEFAPVLTNLWTFTVLLFTGAFFLGIWGIDVTPFLAGAGIAGIVIGIAAQDTIGNFFAGISLNLDRTYQVGDIIQLEDDTRGEVTDISIRSTTLLTRDNIEVAIPNSYLNNTQVVNESTPQRKRRIRLNVGVAYGSDLAKVEEVLLDAMEKETIVLSDPDPIVRFRAFEDSAIRAQLQFYIEHPSQWGRSRHMMIKRIDAAFDDEEIKIPFPQRELSFLEGENELQLAGETSVQDSRPVGFDQ